MSQETFDLSDPVQRKVARTVIAATALHGLLSNPTETGAVGMSRTFGVGPASHTRPAKLLASFAADCADALIEILSPTPTPSEETPR